MYQLNIQSREREQMINITSLLHELVREQGWRDGVLVVYCPHTTGAVTVNESADPDVVRDLVVNLRKLIPRHGDYLHEEGNSDAHLKSSIVGCDQRLLVADGRVQLGTWQGVFFCEFDGPRPRKLWVQFAPAA